MLKLDKLYDRLILFSFIFTFMTLNFLQVSGIQIGDKLFIILLCYTIFTFEVRYVTTLNIVDILPLIIWIGCNIISAMSAIHKAVAFAFTFSYIVQVVLLICFIVLFNHYKIDRIKTLKSIYYTAVPIAIIGIIEKFNYNLMARILSIFREKQYMYGRCSSLFDNPNHFGTFMTITFILGIFFLMKEKKKMKFVIFEILILSGVLFSGSRSAMIWSFVGVTILIYNMRKYCDLKFKKRYLILFFIFIVVLLTLNREELERLTLILEGFKNKDFNMISGYRGYIWASSFEMMKANPLFGIGNGNVQKEMINYINHEFGTHSLYVSLLVENGIVGFTAFMTFVFRSYKKAKYINNREMKVIFYSITTVILLIQITEMQLTNVFQTVFIFWFVLSIPYDKKQIIERNGLCKI